MPKIDLKKDLKHLYQASAKAPAMVEVPRLQYLMVDGAGDPNAPEFAQAAEALFRVSYTLKFMVKKEGGPDYAVMPLEGLWWAQDMAAFCLDRREEWYWTLMILQPDFISQESVARAQAAVRKKKAASPLLDDLRLAALYEGQAAQIMHVGPYADEAPTVARLHRFIREQSYHPGGKHHEIYLGDPRRTAPEKLKTIIRQPITLEAMK